MYTVKIGGKKIKSRLYQEQTGKEAISPMICCTGMHGVHTHTTHIVFYNRKIAELGLRISVQCLDKRNVQQRVKCKKVKSLSPLYCSKIKFINVYSNKATINTALKHCHVVATDVASAQLWEMRTGEVSSYMYVAYTVHYSCGSEILDPRHPANQ